MLIDKDGVTQMTTRIILHTFVEFVQSKYDPIQVDDMCVTRVERAGFSTSPLGWRDFLGTPITEEELKAAVKKGAYNKSPGRDGICLEFFKLTGRLSRIICWPYSKMYLGGRIMEQQKYDIVVCIPKTDISTSTADYRPITLLNTGYAILARIIVNRLRPKLPDMLHSNQYCAVPGNTISGAVATVRGTVAYAELTHAPLCFLSLDFTAAFDGFSHTYRLRTLKHYGYKMKFIKLLLLYFIMSLF